MQDGQTRGTGLFCHTLRVSAVAEVTSAKETGKFGAKQFVKARRVVIADQQRLG
jgi:hypothetical protein